MLLTGPVRASVPLVQLSSQVYQTEHCLFIIDATVPWSSPTAAYADIYSASNGTFPKLSTYFDQLTASFPANYFSVCYIANTGASNVPNYIDRIYKATGISQGIGSSGLGASGVPGTPQSFASVDICRYNLPGGNVITPVLGVFDHELGHAWGAQIFYFLNAPSLSNGHWLPNSTVDCQLGSGSSTDGFVTVNKIYGDPVSGFRWQRVDNMRNNDYSVFSEQTLYLIGLSPTFATSYVLNNPTFNPDLTMSCTSVDTFDHAAAVATYGVRNPDYKTSPKRFKLGFVYIARDVNEVNTVYQAVEKSIDQFCNGEVIDTSAYRSQTPFLVDTHYRASVDGKLSDLDGNTGPSLTVNNPYVTSPDGSASVSFSASDPDGPAPVVSVVPASTQCTLGAGVVQISGLPDGVHFFTLEAVDSGNKKSFGHFVVEVQRPASSAGVATQPADQTALAGAVANFTVAPGGGMNAPVFQWYRQAARTSTWNTLADGGAYAGATTANLAVSCTPAMDGDHFLCVVSDASGAATSLPARLVVNEVAPAIVTQPVDKYVTPGTTTFFRATVGDPAINYGYFQYQWQRLAAGGSTWTDLPANATFYGVNTNQITVYGCTAGMTGDQFRCVITNTGGVTISQPGTLSVGQAPAITSQPLPTSALVGQTASFSVSVSGTGPFVYQWSRYGTPVGNSATLTLANVQLADAGTYGVIVTNSFGLAYSNNVGLSVSTAAPIFSTNPVSQSVTAGNSVTFTAAASGGPPPAYQWRKDGVALSGATGTSLVLANVQAGAAGVYDVIATNSVGSATSTGATLTVNPPLVAPSFSTNPISQSVIAGNPVTFTASATGNPAPAYQWRKDGVALSGATGASLVLANVQAGAAGAYDVIATNSVGSATSTGATLTVNPPLVAPSFSTNPISQSVIAGNLVTFTASATGNPVPVYQWRKDGVALSGATGTSLVLANVQAGAAGAYDVIATNSVGSATSTGATLTVNPPLVAPSFSTNPISQSVIAGNLVTFTASATGNPVPVYQWRKDGVALSGATGTSLVLANVQAGAAGAYDVIATNSVGSATSTGATLTVNPPLVAPSFGTNPVSQSVIAGNPVTFTASATGNPTPAYQWRKDGVAVGGATGASLVLANVQAGAAGVYDVIATNSVGSATSTGATLTVNPPLVAPSFGTNPVSQSVIAGDTVTFTASATGSPSPAYRWQISRDAGSTWVDLSDGGIFSATATAALVVQSVPADQTGSQFRCLATNSGGTAASTAASLVVFPVTGDFDGDGRPDLLWQDPATGDRRVWLMNGTNPMQTLDLGTIPVEWVIAAIGDFNGDGHADLVWQDTSTGQCSIWLMNGTGFVGGVSLGTIPTDWEIAIAADFNGDGHPDLVWQNTVTGQRSIWLMNGTTFTQGIDLGTVPVDWVIASAGDFNRDGHPDLVWENTVTGQHSIWLLSGTTFLAGVDLGLASTSLQLSSVGDFNGDGWPDLIWTDSTTGNRSVWLMNGTTPGGTIPLAASPAGWTLGSRRPPPPKTQSANLDFNGDGKSDLLWQNFTTGQRAIWLMNGTAVAAGVDLGTIPTDWLIAATGDFNGDGKIDLVWENSTTGQRALWLMNGTAVAAGVDLGTIPTDWRITATGDFNGDGKVDLVWENSTTGQRALWLMNGSTFLAGVDLGIVPTDWVLQVTGDFDGDGQVDLIWQNSLTGQRSIWLMNGTAFKGGVALGTVPTDWRIVAAGDYNGDGKPDLVWQNDLTGQRSIWLMNGTNFLAGIDLGLVDPQWHLGD